MYNQNLTKFIDKYLIHCEVEKGLTTKTLKAYKIDLQQFSDYISQRQVECNKETLQDYLVFLNKKYKVKSVKRKLASIKAFFSYLEYEELLNQNPFSRLRIKLHEPSILPRTIPFTTVEVLLKCAYQQKSFVKMDTYSFRAIVRDIAVLELLFASGMRVSEICSLHTDSINLSDGTIKIFGKGSKERIIQIGNEAVLDAIRTYHNVFSDEITSWGYFFINRLGNPLSDQSVRCMINRYVSLAGIEMHITPHMFRHSFATLLLEEDVDIRYIQHLLGHSSIVTTQIYTHVTSKKQRDILAQKHPRNKIEVE